MWLHFSAQAKCVMVCWGNPYAAMSLWLCMGLAGFLASNSVSVFNGKSFGTDAV
jgi:hypothetical protein